MASSRVNSPEVSRNSRTERDRPSERARANVKRHTLTVNHHRMTPKADSAPTSG